MMFMTFQAAEPVPIGSMVAIDIDQRVRPVGEGDPLFGFAMTGTERVGEVIVIQVPGGSSGPSHCASTVVPSRRWACVYCGAVHEISDKKCLNCGAPRKEK